CLHRSPCSVSSFVFTDTPPTELYTLSLHDALPISRRRGCGPGASRALPYALPGGMQTRTQGPARSVAVGQRMILERRPVHVHAKIVLTPGTWPARSTTRTYGMTHSGPDPLRRKDRRAAEHRPGHERAEQDSA